MRMAKFFGAALLASAACWGLAAPAHAQKSADTLRVAWRDGLPDIDFYYNTLRVGLIVQHHIWDTLVDRDPDTFQIKPLLATSWKNVDDTTIDFTLRDGVTFHNGDKFTADDVVYTIQSILDPKAGIVVPSNYAWLAGAEKIDDLHVRLKLKRVFPAALEYLAMVLPIYPKDYRTRVGHEGFSKAPIGTGPYKMTKADGSNEMDLVRNDAYFAGPKGKPAIGKIVINVVADASTELTSLLSQRDDWIWNFSPDQFDNIGRMPFLQAVRADSMRVGYLGMDAAGRTGPDSPFKNQKVRQAVFYAIDRQAIAHNLVQGGARVLDAPCYPTQFGCDQNAAVKYSYDPAKAKQLLAEAGYPNGFDTEIVSYILPSWTDAIQNYLRAVGIRAHVSQLQVAALLQRSFAGKDPIDLGNWGSNSINDASAFLPYYFGGGAADYVRDPEVMKLVEEGGATTDPDKRRAAYSAAIRRLTEQAFWLPLNTYVTTYAFSKQLNFKPYPDELPRFYLASWK
jgi:peptide/nickel transport system substrate-binding protein